jgi:hypothetical protein
VGASLRLKTRILANSATEGRALGISYCRCNNLGVIAARHFSFVEACTMNFRFFRFFLLCSLLVLGSNRAFAVDRPAAPPPPVKYEVVLRYRIRAPRDQHVVQYDAMIEHLKKLDFQFNPPLDQNPETDREDPTKNQLKGSIASDKFLRLLANPSVTSVLIMPPDFEYPPKDLDKLVRVQLELAGGFDTRQQRELAEQVKAVLTYLQFREAPAYDHRGYSGRPFTRISGTIPQGRLEVLLKDLRGQPAGWFAPRIAPANLPAPLRNLSPISIVEVLADTEPIADVMVPAPREPEFLEKITPDLWALLEAKNDEPIRVELLFAGELPVEDLSWRDMLREAAPGIFIEGHLGQVVDAVVQRSQVKTLAALPRISTLRLPRPSAVAVNRQLAASANNAQVLAESGLAALHKKGYRGQGVRLAIIDTDFRGWSEQVQKGTLPKGTRLVDLTTEHDPDLYPAPAVGDPAQLGHGTQCALAAALAAPDAQLVLVRTEAMAAYQIEEILRYFRGDATSSPSIDRRRDELVKARAELALLRSQVLFERRIVLDSYIDEVELDHDFGFLGPVYGWVFSPRQWVRDQVVYVDRQEKILTERHRRFFALVEYMRSLQGITLVANPLLWNDGLAVGAASPLSRALDRLLQAPLPAGQSKAPMLWFQSAGNTRGQTWNGLFHDEDENGLMEFAPPDYRLKKGQWTTELNFLAWQPFAGPETAELPAGAQLRISLQWREPHDPDYYLRGEEDLYRRPLADLRLVLLRQRDPDHKTLPADAFEVAAVSSGIPRRLEHQKGGSIYEVVLETSIAKAGRYALSVLRPVGQQWILIEDQAKKRPAFVQFGGLKPSGLRPLGTVTLPALEKHWELQPRIFVETSDASRLSGRPVFADFATDRGSVGLPGDARSVITVGAADLKGQPQPYSAGGPLAFAELAQKPTILDYDTLASGQGGAFGTSLATSFAAGTAAALVSSGMSNGALLSYINRQNGGVFKVRAPSR